MTATTNNTHTFLSFVIDNEYFAVNVIKVLEVLQKQKITRVPNVTNDIKGVTNFRGEIIPVFETRTRFGLPDRAVDEKYVIIVLEITISNNKSVIGAIADKVKDVISFTDNEILAVPKLKSKFQEGILSGIYKLNNDYILLLEVDKLFSEEELQTATAIVEN